MKTSLLLIALIFPTLAFSLEKSMDALVRIQDNAPYVQKVTLTHLVSPDSFDGEYFKIVKAKEDEAIRFDADRHLTFRAATTYYHLMKARDYFVNVVKSDYVANLPKMIIRIEITNQFSDLGHFANDNMDPQFNNALTIPAGKGLASRGVKPWGAEIWFRPSKRVHLSEINADNSQVQEFKVLMSSFREQTHMQSLQRFLTNLALSFSDNSGIDPFSQDSIIRTAGSSLLLEAGFLAIDPLTRVLTRKWYWLDTAMVPEIIYHEYAHVALSDHLVLSHSTATIEGMADFFAGQIANSPKLATKIKRYNTFNGKNAKNKQKYKLQFETQNYANTDFVFGMLWATKEIVGDDKGIEFMFELRKKITTNSSVRGQLIEGILETCEEMCESPFLDRLRILKALNLKGL